jgi:hypothetical protein
MSSQFTILCVAAYYTYMYTFRVLLYSSNLLTNIFFSVSITKLGSDEVCNYESNEETSWGCTHTGNAAIWNPQNENYYSYNHEETIEIKDIPNSTIYMNVTHAFSDYETYYENDHRIKGLLYVYVKDELLGTFGHPTNAKLDTHLENGDVNEAYKGDYLATVSCDSDCSCHASKVNY